MNTFNTKEDGTRLYRFYYVEPIIDIYADDEDDMHCYTDPTMEDPDCYPAYIRIDYLSVEEI